MYFIANIYKGFLGFFFFFLFNKITNFEGKEENASL